MRLTADSSKGNVIRSFRPGEVHLRNEIIRGHVILSVDQIVRDWDPPELAQLSINDFSKALALKPDVILFGTGLSQKFPHIALLTEIMRAGVAIEVMDTHAACRTFNVLIGENRAAVAALLVD